MRILAVLLLCAAIAAARAAGLEETVAAVKPSVVAVGSFQRTRSPAAVFYGTGFVVGDGLHVVTNAHVLPAGLDTERREALGVFAGQGSSPEFRPARRVALDEDHDLALLRIEGAPLPALRLGDSGTVRDGRQVAFTGFPIGMVLGIYPVTHRGIVSAITPAAIPSKNSRQLDPKQIARLRTPIDMFQLDATAYPGNSGSPLYDPASGEVLGVINMVLVKESKEHVLDRPSAITYAIPGAVLVRLLEAAGVK